MHKFPQWVSLSLRLFAFSLALLSTSAFAAKTTQVEGDFHLSLYQDRQGQLESLELFTKIADKEVYLGLTCSAMSPFPMLEVLLFNNEVLMETPGLFKVSYRIDGQVDASAATLQGVLRPVNNADEHSNKVRLELASGQVKTMGMMQAAYQTLLGQLKAGHSIDISLKHRRVGEKQYRFSLQGLKTLLTPNESICR